MFQVLDNTGCLVARQLHKHTAAILVVNAYYSSDRFFIVRREDRRVRAFEDFLLWWRRYIFFLDIFNFLRCNVLHVSKRTWFFGHNNCRIGGLFILYRLAAWFAGASPTLTRYSSQLVARQFDELTLSRVSEASHSENYLNLSPNNRSKSQRSSPKSNPPNRGLWFSGWSSNATPRAHASNSKSWDSYTTRQDKTKWDIKRM